MSKVPQSKTRAITAIKTTVVERLTGDEGAASGAGLMGDRNLVCSVGSSWNPSCSSIGEGMFCTSRQDLQQAQSLRRALLHPVVLHHDQTPCLSSGLRARTRMQTRKTFRGHEGASVLAWPESCASSASVGRFGPKTRHFHRDTVISSTIDTNRVDLSINPTTVRCRDTHSRV